MSLDPTGPGARALSVAVERVHGQYPYPEDLLDRDLDLGLVRVRVDQERVPVPVELGVALLRDNRGDDHVPRVGNSGHFSLPSVSSSASSSLSTESVTAGT